MATAEETRVWAGNRSHKVVSSFSLQPECPCGDVTYRKIIWIVILLDSLTFTATKSDSRMALSESLGLSPVDVYI